MASVEVLSATIPHAEEAKHGPKNKPEETKKDDVAIPPPPPPPPPSEQKQTNLDTEHGADVALEPESLAVALEAKANLAEKPVNIIPEKKVVGSLSKVAPEPVEDCKAEENGHEVVLEPEPVDDKAEENGEMFLEREPVIQDHEDKEEKPVEEKEKDFPQVNVEKKED